ncbi:MAG: universal stress protein [Planctomycetes bacterium]|nr:universal stress protein [Planctomycetota bacterium]
MSLKIANILFPTDFSELAQGALPFAKEMAGSFHAQLHCLHVVDEAYQYWSAMGPESIPVGPPIDDMVDLATTRMEKFREEHLGDLDRPPMTHVASGRPFSEIIGYVRAQGIDLIVMATHGRGAIAHMLLGSTTEKVVRKAQCAVLTIRPDEHKFVMP